MMVGMISILGIGYLIERNHLNNQKKVAKSIAHGLEYYLEYGERILDANARVANASNSSDLSIFMESTWQAGGYFDTIYCLDANNNITIMVPTDQRYIGLDMSNLPDLQKARGNESITVSPTAISIRTGDPMVYLIKPLAKGGYIIGELNLRLIQDDIANIENKKGKELVFIMDESGMLLGHPSSELVKQQTNMSNLDIFHNVKEGEFYDSYLYNGKRVIGSAVKVKGTGWLVIDQVPLSLFMNTYVLMVGATLIAIFSIGLTLMKNIRKQLQLFVITPLEQLSRKTNALAIGDFSEVNSLYDNTNSFAELNKLYKDFQLMSNNLQFRESALRESENRHRGLIERMPIGLFRVTLAGKVLGINPMCMFILKYPNNEELYKLNIIESYNKYAKKNGFDVIEDINDIKELRDFEINIQCYNGTSIWIQIDSYVVSNSQEQEMFIEGSIQDITERKLTEIKIKEQQELLYKAEKEKREVLEKALIMKDEFISLISHEFKTPLNVIYSAIQLIESVYFDKIPDKVKVLIGNIKQNTFRQLRLANNLLDITKMNSGQFKLNMKNIDIIFLGKAITESIELYANQKNIQVSFKSNINSKIVSIDDEKFERIILNILSNAIKFTKNGGRISVEIYENKKSNMMEIKITDTGIGIPSDKKDIIFERFGQVDSNLSRQAEGTGLGLTLVKLLVDSFGGTIQVESELEVGSTFIIMLPIREDSGYEKNDDCLDINDRLISEIKVEFSDIYL
jgi:PAS domain S-box-containing protein